MLIRTNINYQLQSALIKVSSFAQSFNESIAVIATTQVGKDSLVHYSNKGKLLFKVDFNDFVDAITQITHQLFAVALAQKDQIWLIDLFHKKTKVFDHKFYYQISCQTQIDYFCTSRLLCVKQYGSFGEKMFFTYYRIDQLGDIHNYASYETSIWHPQMKIRKIGTHSKFVWCVDRHGKDMRAFQLELEGDRPIFQQIKVSLQYLYPSENGQSAIIEMWGDSSRELHVFLSVHDKTTKNVVFVMMIWKAEISEIVISKMQIDEQYKPFVVDIIGCQQFCVFHTFRFANQSPLLTPVKYYRNIGGQNVANQTWVCSHIYKFNISSIYPNQILEGRFENSIVRNINLRTISFFEYEQISFILLSQMFPELQSLNDWDFDLLSDIISVFDYSH